MFLKEEIICYEMLYYTYTYTFKAIVRNRVGKLKFNFLKGATYLKS